MRTQVKSHENTLLFLYNKRYDVRFEYAPWKISDFVSFPLLGFTLVIELINFDFSTHRNTLIIFDQKNDVRFEYAL